RAIRLWELPSGKRLGEHFGHEQAVLCVALSADGKHALSGSTDGGVLTWELATGREHNFIDVNQPAHFVRFLPDGRRALIGGNWTNCLWDAFTGQPWLGPSGAASSFRAAAPLPGGKFVLTGGTDRHLALCALPSRPRASVLL